MIKRIYADNFRCLTNFEFQPKQLNLLLGENGSGKTSLFEVLLAIRNLVVSGAPVASLFPTGKKTIWDTRDGQSFELEIESAEGRFFYRLEIQHPPPETKEEPYIKLEKVEFNGQALFHYSDREVHLFEEDYSPGAVFPFEPRQSFLPNLGSRNSKLEWFKGFIAKISVFQLNPFSLDLFSKRDEPYLTINGSNFVSWIRFLNDERPEAKIECEKRLADLLPGFQRFKFQAAGDSKALLADFERDDGSRYSLLLSQFSEGQKMLSVLYSLLYGLAGSASVLCVDEPENFISLPEVQPWLQGLRDFVEDGPSQALVISHSSEAIDYLAPDSAFRFERPSGDVARAKLWTAAQDLDYIMKPSEILVRQG